MVTAVVRTALFFAAVAFAALTVGSFASNPAQAGASVSAHTKYHDGTNAFSSQQQIRPASRSTRVRRNHH
jgi:hypothetical protein